MFVMAVAESLLSVYQWMELMVVKGGGTATCAINDTINCSAVWTSDFANRVQNLAGMPVAGLGLVWGLTAFGVTIVLARKLVDGSDLSGPIAAAKVWGGLGALSCITFAVASIKIGSLCLTCLATYALTLGFALPALLLLPKAESLVASARWLAMIAVPIFVVLLWPGSQTPKGISPTAFKNDQQREEDILKYFASLEWAEQQAAADARLAWQQAPTPNAARFATHARLGPADAPVKLVEFTDILCGHCRSLMGALASLRRATPAANLSIEPRYYPLDSECNKSTKHTSGDGIRCLGAKVQICLEGTAKFWEVREELFAEQQSLSKEKILALGSKAMPRDVLEACVASPKTQERIDEDVAYAMLYELKGTPLLLLNGKEVAWTAAPFLYGMVMGKGDPNNKYFAKLPPGR